MQSAFSVETGSHFVSIRRSFSLVPSMYGKFILILISSSWISLGYVCCCDDCYSPVAPSLAKSFLLGITEYALNKEETTLSLQLISWLEP